MLLISSIYFFKYKKELMGFSRCSNGWVYVHKSRNIGLYASF